jgi:hypothetical protein
MKRLCDQYIVTIDKEVEYKEHMKADMIFHVI